MGAHLEAQATKMRAIFVVIALSLIATAFTSTHEEGLSEATELIATMKKKGATEADCKDLAKTTCKEVLSEAKKAQKIIDSQSSGAECDRLGQRTVIYATRHYHNNGREDRIFRPLLTTIGSSQYGRQWSGWVNNMDKYFAYSCPNNKAMVGMFSYHHNGYEDRRWRFMCAGFHGVGFRKGGWPGWQTNWDAHFALSCGHNPVVGFSSYHNNHKEDRRWRQQCGHRYNRM